jgi:hypothetical protein
MCNGETETEAVISCKAHVCGLAVSNIVVALIGLLLGSISEGLFTNTCVESAYGGGSYYG